MNEFFFFLFCIISDTIGASISRKLLHMRTQDAAHEINIIYYEQLLSLFFIYLLLRGGKEIVIWVFLPCVKAKLLKNARQTKNCTQQSHTHKFFFLIFILHFLCHIPQFIWIPHVCLSFIRFNIKRKKQFFKINFKSRRDEFLFVGLITRVHLFYSFCLIVGKREATRERERVVQITIATHTHTVFMRVNYLIIAAD